MYIEPTAAKEYTGQAATELHQAAEYQLAARKKMLCCFIIAVVVIAVLVGAIVGTQQSNN